LRAARPLPASLLALLVAAAAALADNASATLFPGETLNGDIQTPGERDVLSIYLPGGSRFSVDALAGKGSALLPDLEMVDPDGDPVFIDLVKKPGPGGVGVRLRNLPIGENDGGLYEFHVVSTAGTTGKYRFRCKAKMPRRFAETPSTAAQAFTFMEFDAPAGSTLRYSIRSLTPGAVLTQPTLVAPGGGETALESLSGGGVPLGEDGTWTLRVFNDSQVDPEVSFVANLGLPKSRQVLYLSPLGFGPAPRVSSVAPNRVLDDRVQEGMVLLGSGFEPDSTLRLERRGQEPLLPSTFVVDGPGQITADFDFRGVSTGGWKAVVENPSGGAGSGKVAVKSAAGTRLPPGAVAATEVWWLDFDEAAFQEDLRIAGLQSPNSTVVSALAEGAVKSYALRWLRVAFDLDPQTGKVLPGSVPVSFILGKPPATLGEPGETYNRVVLGGAAGVSDPSSNPNYGWGDGPLDPGNAAYDDLDPEGGNAALGIRTRILAAPQAASVPAYYDALKALRDQPLGPDDGAFFLSSFPPLTAAGGARYAEIVLAVDMAGRELAGTIAHFVARSMGNADGPTGLAATPMKVGEFASLLDFGFSPGETAALAAAARAGIPGKSKALAANHFPAAETRAYLLPNATTTKAYGESFAVAGGRPERDPSDLEFTVIAGLLPPFYSVDLGGAITGTAPLRFPDNTLVGDAYRFRVRARDKKTGVSVFFNHRINLLVDTANPGLSTGEMILGGQRNTATINEPN